CIRAMEESIHDRRILRVLYDRDKAESKRKELGYLRAMGTKLGFPVEGTDGAYLDEVTVGSSHGGIIAECTDRRIPSLSAGLLRDNGFYVLIEGIEDPYNFGYAIRSLYACGVDGIVLSPRNWMSAAGVVCRSSAGASELLPMFTCDGVEAAGIFRDRGYKICCAGIRDSVSSFDADLTCPLFLIVGGEKRGISRAMLDTADTVVRIDYGREFAGSLSAASAASMLGYEVLRQNRK
ncbi:MAG: RNA methyltransferase, partial [Clostridia bacterium]|nr:RNA methyltransferase [Clostridia bacterium]